MILDLSQTSWFKPGGKRLLPPGSLSEWLTKPYVLGEALDKAHGRLEVEVLSEGFEQPFAHEPPLLEIQTGPFFIREVYLKNSQRILTYGRVTIPHVTFVNNQAKILKLKNKSFGKYILYSHPNYKRGAFEYACIEHLHNTIWGRRSVFWLNLNPLIVTEFYMTDLGPYPRP